jgi:hypothetical protein
MLLLNDSSIDQVLEYLAEPFVKHEPIGASGWVAFPPTLQNEKLGVVVDLVRALDKLFQRYPIDAVYSNEPRYYRRTPRGQRSMLEAVQQGQIRQLIWTTPSYGPGGPGRTGLTDATCIVSLGSNDVPGSVGIVMQPATHDAFKELVEEVAEFLTSWFAPLEAANAFVSHYGIVSHGEPGDHPLVTRFERRSTMVSGWHALQRFVRGVFWGMGLGAELCTHLGGPQAVLQEAPVLRANPLGTGVWLQVSDTPPGSRGQLERLAKYLQPLLGTSAEIRAIHAEGQLLYHPTQPPQPAAPVLQGPQAAVAEPNVQTGT